MHSRVVRWTGVALAGALAAWLPAAAQGRGRGAAQNDPFAYETAATDPPPVSTHHSITVNGKTLSYTATVGKIPVPDETGKTEGHMFYVAYTLDNADSA